ncbi:MAG: 4a-hydroxytetrahydrobiopterin dehydratase [Patescibacteria group bacterium]
MEIAQKKCLPCEGFKKPFSSSEIQNFLDQVKEWEVFKNRKIKKEFKFKDFKEVMVFVNKVAQLAEEERHHPDIHIFYNHVKIELFTHAIGGLSENDFIMAAKFDKLTNDEIPK